MSTPQETITSSTSIHDPRIVETIDNEDQDRQLLLKKMKAQKKAKAKVDFEDRCYNRALALELAIQREAIADEVRLKELPRKYGCWWFNKVEGTDEDCPEAAQRRVEDGQSELAREKGMEDERLLHEAKENEKKAHLHGLHKELETARANHAKVNFKNMPDNLQYERMMLDRRIEKLEKEICEYQLAEKDCHDELQQQGKWEYISQDQDQKRRQEEEEKYDEDVKAGVYVNMLKERFADFDATVLLNHGLDIKRKMIGAFKSRNC